MVSTIISQLYKKKIAPLPKGSIVIKKLYVYLSYRKNGKVRSEYVGKDSSGLVEALKEKIKLRMASLNKQRNEEKAKRIQKKKPPKINKRLPKALPWS